MQVSGAVRSLDMQVTLSTFLAAAAASLAQAAYNFLDEHWQLHNICFRMDHVQMWAVKRQKDLHPRHCRTVPTTSSILCLGCAPSLSKASWRAVSNAQSVATTWESTPGKVCNAVAGSGSFPVSVLQRDGSTKPERRIMASVDRRVCPVRPH